jgi:hypothetical protein
MGKDRNHAREPTIGALLRQEYGVHDMGPDSAGSWRTSVEENNSRTASPLCVHPIGTFNAAGWWVIQRVPKPPDVHLRPLPAAHVGRCHLARHLTGVSGLRWAATAFAQSRREVRRSPLTWGALSRPRRRQVAEPDVKRWIVKGATDWNAHIIPLPCGWGQLQEDSA